MAWLYKERLKEMIKIVVIVSRDIVLPSFFPTVYQLVVGVYNYAY